MDLQLIAIGGDRSNSQELQFILKDQWRAVPGFEGMYEVSRAGSVSVSWLPDASWLPEREGAEACPLQAATLPSAW